MARRLLNVLGDFARFLIDAPVTTDVDEENGVRTLRFNGGVAQSAMRVDAPFDLALSYTETMMGFLLFNASPRHILVVGLGGGSLSKYCYRHFPQAHITTLEINPDVIALRDEFLIPPDNERFRIVHTDAAACLARRDLQADVILLDGYDARGLPEGLSSESFYADCWQVLTAQGVLVANLWGGDGGGGLYLDRLRGVFDDRVWWSPAAGSTNLVAFAVKSARRSPQWARIPQKAQALGKRYRLDLPHVARNMRWRQNPDDLSLPGE